MRAGGATSPRTFRPAAKFQGGTSYNPIDPRYILSGAMYDKNIPKIIEIIEEYPGIVNNPTHHYNLTVLSYSIVNDFPPDLIQFLIDKGADVNKCDDWNRTPLIRSLNGYVGESPDFEIARLLIKNGADINSRSDNCASTLEAVIWGPAPLGVQKKILNFLFNIRDSEGRRIEIDCDYKDERGFTMFELAKEVGGADYEAFLRKKCNEKYARNISAAEEVWHGNKEGNSGFGRIPKNVLYGNIGRFLGVPEGPLKPGGTRRYLHPAFVMPTLKSGVIIPKGHEEPLSKLYEWAEDVRKGTSKARATHEAARGLVSLSQQPHYRRNNGKTVTFHSQRKKVGGRRRRTRRRR